MFCLLTDLLIGVNAASSFRYSKYKILVQFQTTKYYYCTARVINLKSLFSLGLIIFSYRRVLAYAVFNQLHCSFLFASVTLKKLFITIDNQIK